MFHTLNGSSPQYKCDKMSQCIVLGGLTTLKPGAVGSFRAVGAVTAASLGHLAHFKKIFLCLIRVPSDPQLSADEDGLFQYHRGCGSFLPSFPSFAIYVLEGYHG